MDIFISFEYETAISIFYYKNAQINNWPFLPFIYDLWLLLSLVNCLATIVTMCDILSI
jgi:hypothetical protein